MNNIIYNLNIFNKMNKVDFIYNDNKYFIQCNNEDKMGDILTKFANKAGKNINKFFFYITDK